MHIFTRLLFRDENLKQSNSPGYGTKIEIRKWMFAVSATHDDTCWLSHYQTLVIEIPFLPLLSRWQFQLPIVIWSVCCTNKATRASKRRKGIFAKNILIAFYKSITIMPVEALPLNHPNIQPFSCISGSILYMVSYVITDITMTSWWARWRLK